MTDQDATQLTKTGDGHRAVVLVADVLGTGLSEDQLTDRAAKMQQIVGEAVYLYDGRVTDPFGPLLMADMPDARKAIEAARKARADLVEYNKGRGKDAVQARIVVHAGEVKGQGASLSGRAVEIALSVLDSLPAKQVAISGEVLSDAGVPSQSAALTALGDVRFYDVPPEVSPEAAEVAVDAPTVLADRSEAPAGRSGSHVLIVAISVVAILILAAVGWYFLGHKTEKSTPSPVVEAPNLPQKAAIATNATTRLIIEPFKIGADATPDLAQQVSSIRRVTVALLESVPSIEVIDVGESRLRLGADVRTLDTGTLLVPFLVTKDGVEDGQGVDPQYVGAAARGIAWWVAQRVGFSSREIGSSNDEAMDHFAKAVMLTRLQGMRANQDAETELQAAMDTDPRFVAAYLFAEKYWSANYDKLRALQMIRDAHDLAPDDVGVLRRLGRAELAVGNVSVGLDAFAKLLKAVPGDVESLRIFGRHALAVGNEQVFQKVLDRLSAGDPLTRELHPPDIIAASGDVNRAIGQYYQLETQYPTNLSLAFKIGRIAVLRRSAEIANLEIDKLRLGDQGFRYQMLQAYIAANAGNGVGADAALELAKGLANREDSYHTYAAEVYAIVGESDKVLTELRQAVDGGEPTLELIRTDQLFKLLEAEPDYRDLMAQIDLKKAEIEANLLTTPIP